MISTIVRIIDKRNKAVHASIEVDIRNTYETGVLRAVFPEQYWEIPVPPELKPFEKAKWWYGFKGTAFDFKKGIETAEHVVEDYLVTMLKDQEILPPYHHPQYGLLCTLSGYDVQFKEVGKNQDPEDIVKFATDFLDFMTVGYELQKAKREIGVVILW